MTDFATLTKPESTCQIWDAIVIGAGPAGAVAARQLALRGLQVLLVERQVWPRIKVCGGCLNGRALLAIKSIGLERTLEDSDAAPITRLIVQARRRSAEVKLPGGVAVNRSQFDAALVDAAINAGAKFLPATKATVTPSVDSAEVRRVTLTNHGDQHQTAIARVIVAADGLGHPSLKALPEFSCYIADGARIGLSLIVEQLPPTYHAGAVYMAVSQSGYVGLVRTRDGRGNLAAAVDSRAMKSAVDPSQMVGSILADAGLPSLAFSGTDGWRGTIPLMRRSNRLSTHRVLLLGDAAGYAEPFTGEGIGWALSSAVAATPVIASNLDRWNTVSIDEWENMQRRQMLRGQLICRTLAHLLRRPAIVRMATWCAQSNSILGTSVGAASLSGRAKPLPATTSVNHDKMIMDVQIVGIGTAVPEFEIDQVDAAQQASLLCCATLQQQRVLSTLYRRTGVAKRHSVVLTSSTNGHPAEQSFYLQDDSVPEGPTTAAAHGDVRCVCRAARR